MPGNPFDAPPPSATSAKLNLPPANSETAAKIDAIGRKLATSYPKAGLAPTFVTIGSSEVEIFHTVDLKQVCVTEGLLRKCQGDEEIAAVLARELGTMAAERLWRQALSNPDRGLPPAVPIGSDRGFELEGASRAELARYDGERRARQTQPDRQQLALTFLMQAGYPANGLQVVQPILREAEQNCSLERQYKGMAPR